MKKLFNFIRLLFKEKQTLKKEIYEGYDSKQRRRANRKNKRVRIKNKKLC